MSLLKDIRGKVQETGRMKKHCAPPVVFRLICGMFAQQKSLKVQFLSPTR